MWLVIFGVTIILCVIGIIYLINAVSRFGLIRNMKKKWQRILLSALILFGFFGGFTVFLGLVNAMAILLYFLMFFILSGIIVRVFWKVRKTQKAGNDQKIISSRKAGISENGIYYQGWLAIAISIIYLSVAFYLCHSVVRTEYDLTSDKSVSSLRIALIADSHLGTTFDGDGFARELSKIKADAPDLLIIAGDFVDNDSDKKDMVRACEALGNMKLKYGVFFSYGNHDKHSFNGRDFTARDLEKELTDNGVHVLEDELYFADDLCIAGRKDSYTEARCQISELLKEVDEDKYIIVIDHEPTDYDNEANSPADLVLSGHTHGGQLLIMSWMGEGFGVNDNTYGYEKRGNTDFIVTSGISDWALDFKTGTRSEYVIINVN